jgi:type IV secretion system protein VirB10
MIALAVGILGIIVLTGDPAPASSTVAAAPAPVTAPSPDRLRDYQDRLRVLDARAREQRVQPEPEPAPPPPTYMYESASGAPAAPDPLVEERKRREYESLSASNVVLSRRPEGQRLSTLDAAPSRSRSAFGAEGLPAPPSIDEVADAVIRATSCVQPAVPTAAPPQPPTVTTADPSPSRTSPLRPAATGPITSVGPLHPVLEGTLIDAVLTNRLDGGAAAPVNCLVTNPVYSHDGRHVLIPAGAEVDLSPELQQAPSQDDRRRQKTRPILPVHARNRLRSTILRDRWLSITR